MTPPTPFVGIQTISAGELMLVAVGLSLVLSVALSFLIGGRALREVRDGERRPVLLACGIVLLSGVPVLLNLGVSTLTNAPDWTVSIVADLSKLAGVSMILLTIYGH